MNARLALGAGCCLVCAATGLLLTQPTTLPAQSGGGSQATLNSAVRPQHTRKSRERQTDGTGGECGGSDPGRDKRGVSLSA